MSGAPFHGMRATDASASALDLSVCDREPIHTPGAIQPHGALLAALADGMCVTHASANLHAVLGLSAKDILGRPLAEVVGTATLRDLSDDARIGERPHALSGPDGAALHLRAHRTGRHVCVDIEPIRPEPWQRPPLTSVQAVLETFKGATGREELCQLAVRGLRAITGYDRAMAYRFGEGGHGEVIAESRADKLKPYLGLRYPASDVPQQARLQYVRQRVGVVADCTYQPVPLLADPALDDGTPLDLTHSGLRSVSPIHREYMRNMKTRASLTIGLTDGEALWGMLVCHHASPRLAGPELRAVAHVIGQVVSLLLHSLVAGERAAQKAARDEFLPSLIARFAANAPLPDTLAAMETELLELVRARGALIRCAGATLWLGKTPPRPAAERALATLHPGPGGEIVAIDDLGLRIPSLADCTPDGSGALLMPIGDSADDAILWFRPEQTRTITWGGNPHEHVVVDRETARLSPRTSFAAWKDVVRGRSAPWTDLSLSLVGELRRVIENELARRTQMAHDLFHSMFESSPSALVLTDVAGAIKLVNRQAELLFGYPRAALADRPIEVLMPPRFRARHAEHRQRFVAEMSSRAMGEQLELYGLRADGTEFPLEIGLSPIDPFGFSKQPMVQAFITDITARRRIEEERAQKQRELEQSNADLEEFSYAVSHDLRAPLRAIGHLADWISQDVGEHATQETRADLKLLQERVVRMQKLLDGLLQYSRLGREGGATEDVDIAAMVAEIAGMLGPPDGFTVTYRGAPVTVRAHRIAIQMVLENLIGNALKHHDRPSGRVTVSARRGEGLAAGQVECRVADDGPGIPAEFHDRIFVVFETLKSRDVVEASGIGLALVKRKVESHGGRIRVESAPPARGAAFVFTWQEAGS